MSNERVTAAQIEAWRYQIDEAAERLEVGDDAGLVLAIREAVTIMRTLLSERDDAQQKLAEARSNADFLRESVGECHLMISRNTPDFQRRKEWDSTNLPPRLQHVMQERDALRAELARLRKDYSVDVIQDDVGAILRALGLGDHARSKSCHQVVHDEILPAIRELSDNRNEQILRVSDLLAEVTRLSGKTQFCHECERRQREIDRLTHYIRFADQTADTLLVADPPPPPISQAEIDNLRHLVDVLRNEWRNLIAGRLPESAHKDVLRRLESLEQAVKKI